MVAFTVEHSSVLDVGSDSRLSSCYDHHTPCFLQFAVAKVEVEDEGRRLRTLPCRDQCTTSKCTALERTASKLSSKICNSEESQLFPRHFTAWILAKKCY